MASKTTRKNPNALMATRRNVAQLKSYRVQVGWSKALGADPETVAIAAFNTIGTDTIHPRDALTPALTANLERIRRGNAEAVRAAQRGDDPMPELEELAADLELALKRSIEEFNNPPNAESTVDQKGFNDPLVGAGADGGRLVTEAAAGVLKR